MDCGSNVNLRHNDPSCVNLVTPNSCPVGNITNDSILRNHLHADPLYDLELMPLGKDEKTTADDLHSIGKDTLGSERTNISLLKVEENQVSISPAGCSVVLQKSVQGSKLNVNLSNVLAKQGPAELEKDDSDPKTGVRQFIYESVRYILTYLLSLSLPNVYYTSWLTYNTRRLKVKFTFLFFRKLCIVRK